MNSYKKKFLISVGLIVFSNVFLLGGIYCFYYKITSKSTAIVEFQKEITVYEKKMEGFKKLEKSLVDTEEQRLLIEEMFIGEGQVIDFIEELEVLAQKSGVILEMKHVAIIQNEKERPLFAMALTGSFKDIYKYLILLENNKYYNSFKKAYIEKTKDGDWKASLELELLSFKYD